MVLLRPATSARKVEICSPCRLTTVHTSSRVCCSPRETLCRSFVIGCPWLHVRLKQSAVLLHRACQQSRNTRPKQKERELFLRRMPKTQKVSQEIPVPPGFQRHCQQP